MTRKRGDNVTERQGATELLLACLGRCRKVPAVEAPMVHLLLNIESQGGLSYGVSELGRERSETIK